MSTLLFQTQSAISWIRAAWLAHLEDAVLRAEGSPEGKGGNPVWMFLSTTGGMIVMVCLCSVLVIAILTLLGPTIGNAIPGSSAD
jgi:hypothetical protein